MRKRPRRQSLTLIQVKLLFDEYAATFNDGQRMITKEALVSIVNDLVVGSNGRPALHEAYGFITDPTVYR